MNAQFQKKIGEFAFVQELLERYNLTTVQLRETIEQSLRKEEPSSQSSGTINMNTNNNLINLNFNLNMRDEDPRKQTGKIDIEKIKKQQIVLNQMKQEKPVKVVNQSILEAVAP